MRFIVAHHDISRKKPDDRRGLLHRPFEQNDRQID